MSDMLIQEDPSVAAKRRLALAMMQQGIGTPIQSGNALEPLARLAQTLIGAYMEKKAGDEEKSNRKASADALAEAVSGATSLKSEKGIQYSPSDFQGSAFDQAAIAAAPEASGNQKRAALISALSKSPNEGVRAVGGRMGLQLALADPVETWETITGDKAKAAGYDPSGVYSRSTKTGEVKQVTAPNRPAPALSPERQKQELDKAAAGKSVVTVDQRQDNREAQDWGADLVKNYTGIRERADVARTTRNQLQMAMNIKDLPGSPLEPYKASVGALAQAFNVPEPLLKSMGLDKATDAQAFEGIMENIVLSKMQAQKGPQTENDAKRIKMTVASQRNTPEARNFLNRAALELSNRDILQQEFYLDWRTKHKTFDGAEKGWQDFMANVPMVASNPNSNLPVFFTEFVEKAREATVAAGQPEPPFNDLLNMWKTKYAGRADH
jgi:hypothetical protein